MGSEQTGAAAALARLVDAAHDGRLDAICDRLGVRLLGVFGSAAQGEPAPHDLDVAVSFRHEARVLELLDVLTELTGYDHIDLAVIDGADPVLRARALVGIGLFEHAPSAWAESQIAALAEERDTAHLRELDRRVLAGEPLDQ
jgi:predicted nucleotidyltransferase